VVEKVLKTVQDEFNFKRRLRPRGRDRTRPNEEKGLSIFSMRGLGKEKKGEERPRTEGKGQTGVRGRTFQSEQLEAVRKKHFTPKENGEGRGREAVGGDSRKTVVGGGQSRRNQPLFTIHPAG